MMHAKEAAKMAEQAHLDINNTTLAKELPAIEKWLQDAISKGKRSFTLNSLSDITRKHIEANGYTVKYEGGYHDSGYYNVTF